MWADDVFADPEIRTGDYLVTRPAEPEFFDGVAFAGPPATFQTGDASLQPASGQQLRVLPEGVRADSAAQLWCKVQLRARPLPDVVTVTGHPCPDWNSDWLVYQVVPWVGHGSAHCIAYLSRVT